MKINAKNDFFIFQDENGKLYPLPATELTKDEIRPFVIRGYLHNIRVNKRIFDDQKNEEVYYGEGIAKRLGVKDYKESLDLLVKEGYGEIVNRNEFPVIFETLGINHKVNEIHLINTRGLICFAFHHSDNEFQGILVSNMINVYADVFETGSYEDDSTSMDILLNDNVMYLQNTMKLLKVYSEEKFKFDMSKCNDSTVFHMIEEACGIANIEKYTNDISDIIYKGTVLGNALMFNIAEAIVDAISDMEKPDVIAKWVLHEIEEFKFDLIEKEILI